MKKKEIEPTLELPQTELKRTGGEQFDPNDENVYFLASGVNQLSNAVGTHKHLLIAVNEIAGDKEIERILSWGEKGTKLFLDSGVFNLSVSYAKSNGISMDQALTTDPSEMPGFDELFEKYLKCVERLAPILWGYIEIDLGGRENKIKTRNRIESLGLSPIPVYHPFSDGWDYFDYLAQRYDRICFGNVVQANSTTRKRLLATAWERRQKYPNLWIHLLGMTPNQYLNAYPINSADSSSWLCNVRWTSSDMEKSALQSVGRMPRAMAYVLGENTSDVGADKAVRCSAYRYQLHLRNWRNHVAATEALGCDARGTLAQNSALSTPGASKPK